MQCISGFFFHFSGKVVDGLLIVRKIEVKSVFIFIDQSMMFVKKASVMKRFLRNRKMCRDCLSHGYQIIALTLFGPLPPDRMFQLDPTTSPNCPSSSRSVERCEEWHTHPYTTPHSTRVLPTLDTVCLVFNKCFFVIIFKSCLFKVGSLFVS